MRRHFLPPATQQKKDPDNAIRQRLPYLCLYDLDLKSSNTGDDILSNFQNRKCSRTQLHSRYCSLANLQMSDLPDPLATEQTLQFVKMAGTLVVRLCVSYTSTRRGKFALPDTSESNCKRYATGWACHPFETNEGSIKIITARHVVYNNSEAKKTEATFFYDGPNQSEATVARGVKLEIIENERDFAILECVTDDETVRARLVEALDSLRHENVQFKPRPSTENGNVGQNRNALDEYIVLIISHPHGGSKHVTFGSCKDIKESDTEFNMTSGEKSRAKNVYTYDAVTCPGSSGAPVIVFGEQEVAYFWAPHSHVNDDGNGVSAPGLVVWRSDTNN